MTSTLLIATLRVFILPPVSLLMLFLFGYLIKHRHPRIGRSLCAGALILLLAISTSAGAWLLLTPLENLEAPLTTSQDTGAQAIVVLSAGRHENNPEYANQDIPDYIALARLRYAAKLYRDTGLPILVSGGLGSKSMQVDTLADGLAHALEYEFGIPARWREQTSRNTRENAEYSAKILKATGITHILLVTDAMHMRRAKVAFTQTGMKVTCAPTLFFSREGMTFFSYLPSAEGLRRSHYAIYEWLGLIWYRISNQY
jgi:uncharacterized SAM-binding protein YcdF (DUF218 family)